jgi:hypothetical protein
MSNPVTQAIKNNYEARLELMRKGSLQGQHICTESGIIKTTYAMDVGHALSLEMFLNIWEDPHSFMEGINLELEEQEYNEDKT